MNGLKRIIFTGGGSAGHVTVNIALIPHFLSTGWNVDYIGSQDGIEANLIGQLPEVPYHAISTGKLRRYFSWRNFSDPFKVLKGIMDASRIIKRLKPDVIFSKGGFVSVPVVIGGWLHNIPIVIHESDITPGLANKIAIPFATRVCLTFSETTHYIRSPKAIFVGAIVREELKQGNAEDGFTFCNLSRQKPILLIMGGSQGSRLLNQVVRENLGSLLAKFQIIHICGNRQVDPAIQETGYIQFEFVHKELANLLAISDLVISRAGANAIFELLTLKKPMLLIPLSKAASRGDQLQNAQSFQKAGYCTVLLEEEMTNEKFVHMITSTYQKRAELIANMEKSFAGDAMNKVIVEIEQVARR